MEFFTYEPKHIPISDDVDVLVCGGGPAGIAAAVSAGRSGAKAMLIERANCLGGTATSSLMALVNIRLEKMSGFPKEFFTELSKGQMAGIRGKSVIWDVEAYKILAERMVMDAGVKILLHTLASDVFIEDGEIKGVIVENKSGRQFIRAKVVVDTTGDGDIAFFSKVPFIKGRENDNAMRPMTVLGLFDNVNLKILKNYVDQNPNDLVADPIRCYCHLESGEMRYDGFYEAVNQAKARGLMRKETPINYLRMSALVPPKNVEHAPVIINSTRIYNVDGTNAQDISQAEIEGRKQLQEVYTSCRTFIPGFENSMWVSSSPYVGVRETRRISGQYTLSYEDIASHKTFQDTVAIMTTTDYGTAEVHGPDKGHEGSKDDSWARKLALDLTEFSFPLRCLLNNQVKNLVVAGRCASMTHDADKYMRNMIPMALTGQVAGQYAGMLAKDGSVSVQSLQKELELCGVIK